MVMVMVMVRVRAGVGVVGHRSDRYCRHNAHRNTSTLDSLSRQPYTSQPET